MSKRRTKQRNNTRKRYKRAAAITAVEPALPLPDPDGGDVSLTPDGGIADGDAFTPMPDGPTDDVSILGVGAATIRLPEGGAYCMQTALGPRP